MMLGLGPHDVLALIILCQAVLHSAGQCEHGETSDDDDDLRRRCEFPEFYADQIFGSHREATMHVAEIREDEDFPTPAQFYEQYISQYKPVVARGAAKHSRAYHLWTEEYLKDTFGDLTMKLEPRKEGSLKFPIGERGLGRDTLSNFLDTYQTMDGFVISQVPVPMETDIAFPPFLLCGSIGNSVQEADLYFSAHGGNTPLHRDPYSTFQCVFNGTKQWLVVDPSQIERLYMVDEARYEFGGDSAINVDQVNYDVNPEAKDIEYGRVILNKGDCIYMPLGYTHQVRTKGYMNVAVSIWFSHFLPFDPGDCDLHGNRFRPMSESSVLWRYSGYGILPQGHLDLHMLRTVMKTTADDFGRIWLEHFVTEFIQGTRNDALLIRQHREQFIRKLDPSGKGFVSVEELDSLSLETMKELIETFDPPEMSNLPDFEHHLIREHRIRDLLANLVSRNAVNTVQRTDFIHEYTTGLWGSPQVAQEIWSLLDPDATDLINASDITRHIVQALAKFSVGFQHDPTIEHLWFRQFLQADVFKKFGVTHFIKSQDLVSEEEQIGTCARDHQDGSKACNKPAENEMDTLPNTDL